MTMRSPFRMRGASALDGALAVNATRSSSAFPSAKAITPPAIANSSATGRPLRSRLPALRICRRVERAISATMIGPPAAEAIPVT